MRESGYYWVLYAGEWTIGEWDGSRWFLCGMEEDFTTDTFVSIGDRVLDPPTSKD